MSERQNILDRIREALRVPAPRPGSHDHEPGHSEMAGSPPLPISQWLPPVGDSFEERAAAFARQSTELRSEFALLDSRDGMAARLRELATADGWQRIATHRGELCDSAKSALSLPTLLTDEHYEATEMEKCDVGISQCDVLVAQTGSVVVTAKSAGGRALSVLPPHHVVLATRDQLVRDLPAAFSRLRERYGAGYPSFMSVITGPSRTGDIERILVLGAHGPKKLTILLC